MTTIKLPLPAGKVPPSAVLGPLVAERQSLLHAEADYEAVMAARHHLRDWCGDDWPEDAFTLEQNRADLAEHINDAETGFAYGFTVFTDPGRKRVAGSLYLYPSAYFAGRYAFSKPVRDTVEAALVLADYWLRPELDADPLHERFLQDLQAWLARDWGFRTAIWPTRPALEARRRRYTQSGFTHLATAASLHQPDWTMDFHLSP